MKYFAILIALVSAGCGARSDYVYRIRTSDSTVKKYVLHYVADSSLVVEEFRPKKRGAFSELLLHSIDTLWHRQSQIASNAKTGSLIGAGVGFVGGALISNPADRASIRENFDGLYALHRSIGITGVAMIVAGIGAIIGGAIPSEDTVLLPDDPETLAFLRKHSKLRSFDELPSDVRDTLAQKRD